MKQTLFCFWLWAIFGPYLASSQEIHTQSNAACITNESNSTNGWAGNTVNTAVTNEAYSGSYSIKAVAPHSGWYYARYSFATTPGQQYQIKLYAKSDSPNTPEFHWRDFTDEGAMAIGTQWTEYSVIKTATGSSAQILIYAGVPTVAGNTVYVDHVSITPIDDQDPTPPVVSSSGQSDTTADLSWSGATDNVGVTGYKVFKDGILETTLGNVNTYQVTGLTANTSYNFTVRSSDAAGNESLLSNVVSVTTDSASGSSGGGASTGWTESGSTVSYTGDVAIGASSVPTGYKLAVDGHIRTREIRVDQDSWPDYVFSDGYDLLTLEDIQKHIHEKGHLPNIPSAKEVMTNGMDVAEMNRLLLEKIEEMTLYLLQQQKEIDQMKNKIKTIKK